MANPGREDQYVTLSEIAADTTPVAFDPAGVWASIEPNPPDAFGERKITSRVDMRYHPQITLNTILTTDDGAALFVRGIQRVRRGTERMVLMVEEVETP